MSAAATAPAPAPGGPLTAAQIAAQPRWAATAADKAAPIYRAVVRDLRYNPTRGPKKVTR